MDITSKINAVITGATTEQAPAADAMAGIEISFAPAGKLDADFYNADDLDGITESLFGSGNLNYMMLQARQNDIAAISNNPHAGINSVLEGLSPALMAQTAVQRALDSAETASLRATITLPESVNTTLGGSAAASHAGFDAQAGLASNLPRAEIAANEARFATPDSFDFQARAQLERTVSNPGNNNPGGNNPGGNDPGGNNPGGNNPGNNNPGGNNPGGNNPGGNDPGNNNPGGNNPGGNNPNPGDGGQSGGNPPAPDVDVAMHNNIGLPQIDINVDPVENILGDIDVGVGIQHGPDGLTVPLNVVVADIPVLNGEINLNLPVLQPVLDPVLHTVTPVLSDVTAAVQPVVNDVTQLVETVIGGILSPANNDHGAPDISLHNNLGLPQVEAVVDTVESIVGDIDIINTLTGDQNGLTSVTHVVAANLPIVDSFINANVPLINDAVSNITENPVHGTIETAKTVVDIAADTVSNLFCHTPDTEDVDLAVFNNIGLPQIEVTLDPVEKIIGDIDLQASLIHSPAGIGAGINGILADIPLGNIDTVHDIPLAAPLVSDAIAALQPVFQHVNQTVNVENLLQENVNGLARDLSDIIQPPCGCDDTGPRDVDLAVTNNLGLPQIGLNLDPVEKLTGDIDIRLDLAQVDKGLDIGLDALAGKISLAEDLSLRLPENGGDTNCGPDFCATVEEILSDIKSADCLADTASNLLSVVPQVLSDVGAAAGDIACWPTAEPGNLIQDVGAYVANVADAALNLPEPVGNVSEGLGILSHVSDTVGHGLSGLLNGHHGGLFG